MLKQAYVVFVQVSRYLMNWSHVLSVAAPAIPPPSRARLSAGRPGHPPAYDAPGRGHSQARWTGSLYASPCTSLYRKQNNKMVIIGAMNKLAAMLHSYILCYWWHLLVPRSTGNKTTKWSLWVQ